MILIDDINENILMLDDKQFDLMISELNGIDNIEDNINNWFVFSEKMIFINSNETESINIKYDKELNKYFIFEAKEMGKFKDANIDNLKNDKKFKCIDNKTSYIYDYHEVWEVKKCKIISKEEVDSILTMSELLNHEFLCNHDFYKED